MEKLLVKGHPGRLELAFLRSVSLQEACDALEKISGEEKSFFTNDNTGVFYSGAEFTYDEEMAFEKAVKCAFGKNVKLERKQKLTREEIYYSLSDNEVICKISEKSLRSGEKLVSCGDVLVMGDVNPGASVVANGNITVLGAMRGNAYVRKRGRVYATYMAPSQIRIGKIISYNKKTKNVGPAIALAENGEIIIECL